jgi:hypothetical protein
MTSSFSVEVEEPTFVVEVVDESFTILSEDEPPSVIEVVEETYHILYSDEPPPTITLSGVTFNQPTPAALWTINHNLGFKPVVGLFSTGSQEIEGVVTHTSENQTLVSFSIPVAGFARLV